MSGQGIRRTPFTLKEGGRRDIAPSPAILVIGMKHNPSGSALSRPPSGKTTPAAASAKTATSESPPIRSVATTSCCWAKWWIKPTLGSGSSTRAPKEHPSPADGLPHRMVLLKENEARGLATGAARRPELMVRARMLPGLYGFSVCKCLRGLAQREFHPCRYSETSGGVRGWSEGPLSSPVLRLCASGGPRLLPGRCGGASARIRSGRS